MTTRVLDRAAVPLALLCALVWASGCATISREAERDQQRRKTQAHFNIGVDHLQNDRVALAIRELKAAELLDPDHAQVQFGLGEAFLRKGLFAEAERHILRSLELQPDYHDARLNLSALYIHLERYDEAAAQSQILLDDPTFPAPWRALTNLGWADFKLDRVERARHHLEQALEYNERYWPTLLNLGILELHEGRRAEAARFFQQLIELAPGPNATAEANYRLAEIYVSLGRRERALQHLMTAVAQTPGGEWGRKSEEYLKLLR